ncbi:MAG: formimidoylglutamase [Bacteroidia bacterium]
MNHLTLLTAADIASRTRRRTGEAKLGEYIQIIPQGVDPATAMRNSNARFVLLGIPEDIGIRANYGRGGAWSAWEPALAALLNVQSTDALTGAEIIAAGHIAVDDLMKRADALDFSGNDGILAARNITAELDVRVCSVIRDIVAAGKIPVIVGGGHNNAYGNIRGTVEAVRLHQPAFQLSVLNCDAHSDFRAPEGRHSGNGFRYAWQEGFLSRYSITGLHENYNAQAVRREMQHYPQHFHYTLFENIFVRQQISFGDAVNQACAFTGKTYTGIEIDLDSVENMPSSARTPSGISANEVRLFVHRCATLTRPLYLHLAEAAPVLAHKKMDNKTGKLITYLITDFIKAVLWSS